jgi:hypothetical protein
MVVGDPNLIGLIQFQLLLHWSEFNVTDKIFNILPVNRPGVKSWHKVNMTLSK